MKKYLAQLTKFLNLIKRVSTKYSGMLFLLLFSILAGYLVVRIGYLSRLEPTQLQIDQTVAEIKKTKTDSESFEKLEELQVRNISIEALFDNGRTNPFEN